MEDGGENLSIASSLKGSTQIPFFDAMNPNNRLDVTTKTHLFKFNWIL